MINCSGLVVTTGPEKALLTDPAMAARPLDSWHPKRQKIRLIIPLNWRRGDPAGVGVSRRTERPIWRRC